MVAVKSSEVAGVLRRPDPRIALFLVYGPDAGLVAERAKALAASAVEDPADPFQTVRIEGEVIAADPGRLVDEAGTVGLFGGRRAIWVKATSRNLAPAVETVLSTALQDTTVVIEAGDLARSSPLRVLCERSPKAMALPCYADSERDLEALVDETLKEARLAIGREARAALLASLGGDRLATRGELAKLVLYAHGRSEITLADVDAVLSDVSSLALDAVVDAAFAGDAAGLETGSRRLKAEGAAASTILGALQRHAFALLPLALEVAAGKPAAVALESWRGLHFRRKAAVTRHLQRWPPDRLAALAATLQARILDSRRLPDLGHTLAARALLEIASAGRR